MMMDLDLGRNQQLFWSLNILQIIFTIHYLICKM